MVKLKHITDEYVEALHSFDLPDEQAKFTALPSKVLEEKKEEYRIVILDDNEPVGFFILHKTERVKQYSDNPNAMLLTALSINHAKQGRGYAKQAMLQLRDFVEYEFPYCDEIVLAVNHKNTPAQRLYEKVGFIDTGKRRNGPVGEQFIMNLLLK